MARHPWVFSSEAQGLLQALTAVEGTRLGTSCAEPIGAQFITGADEIYTLPLHLARRSRIPQTYLRTYATGEDVRDWQISPSAAIIFPYDAQTLAPLELLPEELEVFLAPHRQYLEGLIISGTTPKNATNLKWFEYRRLARGKFTHELNLLIPQIAMYNHACLSDHSVAFKEKAQAVVFQDSVSQAAIEAVMGCLNSSTAGFWLKQVCFNKGPGAKGEKDRFEFSGNILATFPIPQVLWEDTALQKHLSHLSQACAERGALLRSLEFRLLFSKAGEAYEPWYRGLPGQVARHPSFVADFGSPEELTLQKSRMLIERGKLLREMVALQEEIDWVTYASYGLLKPDDPSVGLVSAMRADITELNSGMRPHELFLLNALPPSNWSRVRRTLWSERIKTLESNPRVAAIENSLFKRQWAEPDYEREFAEACYDWLRDKAEYYLENHASGLGLSIKDLSAALFQDHRVKAVALALEGANCNILRFSWMLKRVLDEQTVPKDETAFRVKHKQIEGNLTSRVKDSVQQVRNSKRTVGREKTNRMPVHGWRLLKSVWRGAPLRCARACGARIGSLKSSSIHIYV